MRKARGTAGIVLSGAGLCIGLVLAGLSCRSNNHEPPDAKAEPGLFRDVTAETGIDFTYRNGEEAGHYAILESLGGGVALLDYDGDGLLDIFVTGGGYFDGPDKKTIKGHPSKLFKNLGGWKFKDVTDTALAGQALFYTHGCAVADYDRDGWPDLLVTGWGRVALYHNEAIDPADPARGRKLVEVSARAGLDDRLWSTSAAWGDLDGDGYPDLYIAHYVDWSFANHPVCSGYSSDVPRDVCPPLRFTGLPHSVYRNNRDGTFTDVSAKAGLRRAGAPEGDAGKGLGVIIADVNGDCRPDIYVANDTVPSFLYFNRGGWKLEEAGLPAGAAVDERGVPQGSMGIDVGDYDGSGLAALFVTNYENEMHAMYRNLGNRELFQFNTAATGISTIGQSFVGFGTRFTDIDNDGWWDLAISNGHVIRHPRFAGLKQRPILFRNQGKGKYVDVSARGGSYFQGTHRGRGLAVGDLDNDGRPDLVFSRVNEPIAVVRNIAGDEGQRNHWLGITLIRKDHRDAVGTRVTIEAGGSKRTWFVRGGGSYLSACDHRLHFGLGSTGAVERVVAEWSYGGRQEWSGADLAVDRYWELREGEIKPKRASPDQ
jgi:hypothetical protein